MKLKLFLLLFCFIAAKAFSQYPINPVTISMPSAPQANTADWATAMPPVMITAQTKMTNGQIPGEVTESKILVTIKNGGTKVCGSYTVLNAPMANFNSVSKTWSGANVLNLLGQECTLKPGNYQLCVQFFSITTAVKALSNEVCKTFTIAETKPQNITPPQNINPTDKRQFTEKEIKTPITFRWTPITPKPQGQVTYKLKVWQLMQGQNGTSAMKANAPLLEKEVKDMTQAVVANLINGPCFPPFMCDFYWRVDAVDERGKVLGSSTPTSFSFGSPCTPDYEMVLQTVACGQDGKVHITGYVVINPKPTVTINQITITQFNETNFSGATVNTNLTLPKNLSASGNQYPFDFIVNDNLCNKILHIGYQIKSTCSGTGATTITDCFKDTLMPCCKCTTCDQITFNLGQETSQFQPWGNRWWWWGDNNHLYLTQPLVVGPPTIKVLQVKTEVVDFYWYVEGDCKKCNDKDYYWGNLITGNTNNTGFVPTGTSGTDDAGVPLPNSHEMDFISNSPTGSTFNGNVNLQLSLPQQTVLSCCTDCFRFCIRYTIVFLENGVCKTCSKVKCYEVRRQHRPSMRTPWPPINDCGDQPVIIHGGGGGPIWD